MQKILIVDDKEQNLFTLEQVLGELEVEFVRATSGNDALKATLHDDFALAILDVQMPGMDGYELAELLRTDAKTENLPVIFLSAVFHDDYHVFKGYESGAVDFIIKPYVPKILISKVNFFLQLHRQKTALLHTIELEKKKNYLENILFSMADTLLVVNPDGCIETYNHGGLSLVDFDQDTIIGKPLSDLIAEKKYSAWVRNLPPEKRAVQEPGVIQNKETILLTRNEGNIPVLVSASPIYDGFGKLHGAVFVARDLRERKKLEDHFYEARRMESISTLSGGIAHDFNNLLTIIVGNIDLMSYGMTHDDPNYPLLTAAALACSQASYLTQKFILLSKSGIPHKKLTILKPFLADTLTTDLCGPPVRCECYLADDLWPVEMDVKQIGQVIAVVINNAREAMEDGGTIFVTACNIEAAADETVKGFILQDKKYIKLSIKDQGHGIAENNLSRVFDPYYTTKDTYGKKGLGLGLTIAYSIIKQHNGYIEMTSEPGVGTTVHLYLPAAGESC